MLDVHDEVAREKMGVIRQRDGHGQFDALHDRVAVRIDEDQREFARAFVAGHEGDAQGDRALRMHRRHLRRVYGIKRPEEV